MWCITGIHTVSVWRNSTLTRLRIAIVEVFEEPTSHIWQVEGRRTIARTKCCSKDGK